MEDQGGVVAVDELDLIEGLFGAARTGKMQEVGQILHRRPWLVHARDAYDTTALREACLNGHREIVTYLLDKGANVNQQVEGISLLQDALRVDDMALFNLLLKRGADPHLDRYSCLDRAKAEGHSECIKLLEVSSQSTT